LQTRRTGRIPEQRGQREPWRSHPVAEVCLMDDTDYALGRTTAEYERLIEQAALLRPLTERTLRAAGVRAGMRVLDLGCGPGDVGFLVSELVGADGSVVGVDLDGDAVRLADARRAAQAITNVEFRHGDARSGHTDPPFDAAVGRFVLMYMRDPTAALRLVARSVRPGGILAFHEWAAGASPTSPLNLPVLDSLLRLLSATFERSGARVQLGAELGRRMREADLDPDPAPLAEIAVCTGQGPVAYRRWALLARSMLPKMVEYGLAEEGHVLDLIDRGLRDELVDAQDVLPLSWLMIGQWARRI
jgi:SAM-dependent methyltransferase